MKCFYHELRRIFRVVSTVCIVQQFYIILFFGKGANDCERVRARSYQRRKLNLNENHFLGNIHFTKRSVREIDRCAKMYHLFFLSGKKKLRFTFVILRTIQVDKYWITYCGLSLVDMNCSVLTSVSVDMLIIPELFVKK